MLTTEDEARRKSCPETAISERCIGPACMAWRWKGWIDKKRADDHHYTAYPDWLTKEDVARIGYCGKAGKP